MMTLFSRFSRSAALAILALGGVVVTAAPADARGWHRHHRYHHHHHHHRGWVHYYGPRYGWSTAGFDSWGFGCGLRPFVTYYGALAYRQVCY